MPCLSLESSNTDDPLPIYILIWYSFMPCLSLESSNTGDPLPIYVLIWYSFMPCCHLSPPIQLHVYYKGLVITVPI